MDLRALRRRTTVTLESAAAEPEPDPETRNSLEGNRRMWTEWDWDAPAEHWTPSAEWKAGVIQNVIRRFLPAGGTIVEIGPGSGRWSETLQTMASELILADISPSCIEHCRRRFADKPNITYIVNAGTDLPGVGEGTVDAVFSLDVFVHILARDTAEYVREFARVLRPGGTGLIHHSRDARITEWRSGMDNAAFTAMLRENGLTVVTQFDTWDDSGVRLTPQDSEAAVKHGNIYTVFRKE